MMYPPPYHWYMRDSSMVVSGLSLVKDLWDTFCCFCYFSQKYEIYVFWSYKEYEIFLK